MKVSWKKHRTNEDNLSIAQAEESTVSKIRNRKKNCIRHIHRGNSLTKI